MFTISVFNNISEDIKLHKSIIPRGEYPGTLKEECSIINPVVLMELSDVPRFNYIYIPDFHRYYYVTGIKSVRTNLWEISCKVDVLMSYADEIIENSAKIERQEFVYDMYIPDPLIEVESPTQVVTKQIGTAEFESCGFILITQ